MVSRVEDQILVASLVSYKRDTHESEIERTPRARDIRLARE